MENHCACHFSRVCPASLETRRRGSIERGNQVDAKKCAKSMRGRRWSGNGRSKWLTEVIICLHGGKVLQRRLLPCACLRRRGLGSKMRPFQDLESYPLFTCPIVSVRWDLVRGREELFEGDGTTRIPGYSLTNHKSQLNPENFVHTERPKAKDIVYECAIAKVEYHNAVAAASSSLFLLQKMPSARLETIIPIVFRSRK
ncbi:hypothetical protein BDZ45DRAFT_802895 [Acephala macrosclerotiorum]|nr:hypothetical protein BDZ45DRAFT_802895 [Acephala macrosclerotiorum]